MRKKKTFWASLGIGVIFLLSKLKFILVFLKFFKLTTLVTLIVSMFAYGMVYGWAFGAVLVYLLVVHEMGHVWAMNKLNIPTNPTLFIPFIGGVASGKEGPRSAYDDAFISYMGPVFGLLSVIPAILLYHLTGNEIWMLTVMLGSILNLFNLIPMTPLDGGHIIKVVNIKLLLVGFLFGMAFVLYTKSYSFIFFILLGILYVLFHYFERKNLNKKQKELYKLNIFMERLTEMPNDKMAIKKELKEECDRFSESFKQPFQMALRKIKKRQEEDEVLKTTLETFEAYIMEKKREHDYYQSFSLITLREKRNVLLIYIGLIALFLLGTYYGFSILGEDIKSFTK